MVGNLGWGVRENLLQVHFVEIERIAFHKPFPYRVMATSEEGTATAVVMNVTVAAPSFGGYLTVWPAGGAMPDSSNLNFSAGQVTANLVVVPLGPDGGVGFFNAFGSTPVIADVVIRHLADLYP